MQNEANFAMKYKIMASDMDVTYRLTPNAVLLYFQDCFANYLSSRKLAAFDIVGRGLIWMITEFEVHFTGERPFWSEDVYTEIWISSVTNVKVNVSYRLYNQAKDLFAEGCSTWTIMDLEARRPYSPSLLLPDLAGTDEHRKRRPIPSDAGKQYYNTFSHKVNISDLDFNGHVCNRSYLALATSTAPVDFIKTHNPKYLHIKFLKEAFFGEELTCEVLREPDAAIFWHNINGSAGKEVSKVYSEWTDGDNDDSISLAERIKRPSCAKF